MPSWMALRRHPAAPSPEAVPPLEPPALDGWLLKRAGRFPFWHGSIELEEALRAVYHAAGEEALTRLAQTWPSEGA